MSEEGAVVGHAVGRPGEVIHLAAQSIREAMERPMHGRPHTPSRVRVASPELAQVLRSSLEGIEIVCAPTPEVDAVFEAMRRDLSERSGAPPSYLWANAGPERVEAFFRAAAALFRARPWATVPADDGLIAVTIESLELRDAVVSVIGQMQTSFGILLFASLADFHAYLDAADAMQRGERAPSMPKLVALNFEKGADLSPLLRKEIATHRWEVAGASAYPWPVAVGEDLVSRTASARELAILEAICLALPVFLSKNAKALRDAWYGGPAVEQTVQVRAHAGELAVTLRVPCERPSVDAPIDTRASSGSSVAEPACTTGRTMSRSTTS
jgi:hypothetical protein